MNFFTTIWENKYAKEFLLMLASAAAVQLALGLNDLMGAIETAQSWRDLLTSAQAWAGAFSFALVVTVVKQSLAWGIAKLGGASL
jgi:hypothetical protein